MESNVNFKFLGFITVAVNGVVIRAEKEEYFENSSEDRPKSLKGKIQKSSFKKTAVICAILMNFISDKITLMKSYYPGIWYQEESDMTNVNIFRNKIT